MKRTITFMLLALCALSMHAQDIIYLNDGSTVKAKVSEINDNDIKYKRFDNQSGPTYTISRTKTEKIVFENGTEENVLIAKASSDEEYSRASWFNPVKWTARNPVGLSPYVDFGGIFFNGPRAGVGIRWRQLQFDGYFKPAGPGLLNQAYYSFNDVYVSETDSRLARVTNLRGAGGGFTVKVLFPVGTKGCTFHLGVLNEWGEAKDEIEGYYPRLSRIQHYYNDLSTGTSALGFGFSWHHDEGLYFLVGGYWGVIAFDRYHTDMKENGNMHYNWSTNSWTDFFGTLELTVGYDIPLLKNN